MASPIDLRVGEARLAGALARLLRWEAKLLAREQHDGASRAATMRGLEWAAEFVRALEAEPCAGWLDALRERGAERPTHPPGVWRALGAPTCAEIAEALDATQSLAPLAPASRGWRGMATAVRAWEEPSEPVAEPTPEPAPAPAPEPDPGVDLSAPAFRFGDRVQVPEGTRVDGDPVPLRALLGALAEWAGPYGARTTAKGGRVELAGARPSEHGEAGRIADGVLESLRQVHLACARVAAPLVVDDPVDGAVRWSVRLPAATDARHLFAEIAGTRVALPWHAVVAYGLGDGGKPHVVLGRGLERIAVGLDWLHGLGPGTLRPRTGDAPALAFETGALGFVPREVVNDEGEAHALVELRPLVIEPAAPVAGPEAVEEAEEAPPAAPEATAPAACPAPAPEAVESAPPPADNPGAGPSRRALVADDSFTARVFLRRLLAMRGIEVDEAEHGDEARARLSAGGYDLAFLDADMPAGGAIALASTIAAEERTRIVVLVRDEGERAAANAAGFARTLFKPFADDEVAAALAALAEESRPGA